MSRLVEIRRGVYRDSVSLMVLSRELAARSDVSRALVAMATELNLAMAGDLGFDISGAPTPVDLLVAIQASDDGALATARDALDAALQAQPSAGGGAVGSGEVLPPTVGAAARRVPDASLVLVSTPGRVAAIDAADALASGLDVMIFSDNVSIDDEVALKRMAAESGLLVMGPDCGTAVVDGVGLGFANVVRPGPVGLVAASGTGAQQVMSLLDASGVGVRHCLGVGGRDLSSRVAASSTLEALRRLDTEDGVEVIVVVSKPPAAEVADRLHDELAALGTPVLLGLLAPGRPDLTDIAAEACGAVGAAWVPPRRWGEASETTRSGNLHGLFCGGTLCTEAEIVATPLLGAGEGHRFVDFGDDAFTAGRPHPMIDPSLRLQHLERSLGDPACAVVLIDVVLGLGAHRDPAADLVPVIRNAARPVVVSLVGTRDDPQDLISTAERLAAAGAVVSTSNAEAARTAARLAVGDRS